MNQRQTVAAVVAVIALGGAGYLYFVRGNDGPGQAQRPRTSGVCLATGWQGDAYAHFTEYPPLTCPDCGKQTFYPYWYCEESGVRFVPDLRVFQPGGGYPYSVRCPRSGNPSCTPWIPEINTTFTDHPLPKLRP
ncbi:MAG: hypothetical protein IPM18_15895 [Phycisphaerales bacterium]|nr:hypothetical protein [Phycisphaerales bacterium]